METDMKAIVANKNSAIKAIRLAYKDAKSEHWTNIELTNRVLDIRDEYYRDAPDWVVSEFNGYKDAMYDNLIESDSLVHGGYSNGKFYSTDCERVDYYGNNVDYKSLQDKGFYWHNNLSKPFFIIRD